MDPDLDLMRRLQTGEEAALNELMARHKEAVFHFILRYTRNEADAAELTEETFARVYFHAAGFQPKAKVKTWIFSIASNLCRDRHRKKKRFGLFSLDEEKGIDEPYSLRERLPDERQVSPAQATETRETIELIEKEIDRLPVKLKIPFVFCVLEGHSYEECAEMIQRSVKTVETRIYRARKILRQLLESFHAKG